MRDFMCPPQQLVNLKSESDCVPEQGLASKQFPDLPLGCQMPGGKIPTIYVSACFTSERQSLAVASR